LKIASFNVLNYFTTIDSRGANSISELDRQRAKIATAICAMDADIVGLIEIENNGSVAISDLLNGDNGINANCGPYEYIDTGVIGTDEITVAFIYDAATVTPVGDEAILDSSVDPRFLDQKNRPALAQTFEDSLSGGKVTVVVNHLKSKGSSCDDVGDPDLNDGQANCNITRTNAALAMVDWLATDPTGSGDPDFLIIGDLNSYRMEDPIDALKQGSDDTPGTPDDYSDLLDMFVGASVYSYLFDGQLGYLDHALANNALLTQVTGVTAWNINSDEIPVFDYNDDIQDPGEASFQRESSSLPIYQPNELRSSDHDPVIVGLDLTGEPTAVTIGDISATVVDGTVHFSWTTVAEINTLGFNVYRSAELNGSYEQVNTNLVAAMAGTGNGMSYSITDQPLNGIWFYALEEIDLNGTTTRYPAIMVDTFAPTAVNLTAIDGNMQSMALPLLLVTLVLVILGGQMIARKRDV
jgi:predicted extracellular nuclease